MDDMIQHSAISEARPEGMQLFRLDLPPRQPKSAGERRSLSRAIEHTVAAQVIPRLVLAGRAAFAPAAAPLIALADVTSLAEAAVSPEEGAALGVVASARARGVPLESIYLDLLAPAARHLGELWDNDTTDFSTVTLGLWRLHGVMRAVGPAFWQPTARRLQTSRALLSPVPGAQHNFGVMMVADFFRRAGWSVWCEPATTAINLTDLVRAEWFAVIGFSIGTQIHVDELASCIRAVRRASRNRALGVMVGGPLVNERPELVQLVGADATARDGWQAVLQAQGMLNLMAESA